MIYSIDQVRHLHLEISSLCNAACPLCPRNFNGYPHNAGYDEHNMTLQEAQKIFPVEFVQQLDRMIINGNFGDAVMNPETVEIVNYFKQSNPNLHINLSTNGGARDAKFWRGLAEAGIEVTFCVDGLDDYTHALYRRNTLYSTIMRNSATFIAAGGRAVWKMIEFYHNTHQMKQARKVSVERGFAAFMAVNDGRDTGPVYNNNGDLIHIIGESKINFVPSPRVESALERTSSPKYQSMRKMWVDKSEVKDISCEVAKSRSVYVSSTGDVFPCCYTGLNPARYRNNTDIGYSMEQINHIMTRNNALEHSLATCIEWFDQIEASWNIDSFDNGRLLTCNNTCGSSKRDKFHVKDVVMYNDNAI
jgi:MoaA/NifB/PqqE/SkfB family radical SAM enzyme